MPRPPILPVPDRRSIFESGEKWKDWLDHAGEPENAEKMRNRYRSTDFDKTVVERLARLPSPVNVIAIAESWCGDVVRQAPLLVKMADLSKGQAAVRFIARGDHPDFFVRFLTNGGEAIPKFIFCNGDFTEVGNYGPMPATPRRYMAMGKSIGNVEAGRRLVNKFYERDGDAESIRELLELFELAALEKIIEPL